MTPSPATWSSSPAWAASGGSIRRLTSASTSYPRCVRRPGRARRRGGSEGQHARAARRWIPASAFDIIDILTLEGSPADLGDDAIAVYPGRGGRQRARDRRHRPGHLQGHRPEGADRSRSPTAKAQTAGDYFVGIDAYEANFAHQLDSAGLHRKGGRRQPRGRPSPRCGTSPTSTPAPRFSTRPATRPSTARHRPACSDWSALRPARAGDRHCPSRHREHPGTIDPGPHPRTRAAPGRRHDPITGAYHGPLGGGGRRCPRHGARAW